MSPQIPNSFHKIPGSKHSIRNLVFLCDLLCDLGRLSMVQFVNLLNQVQTCTTPQVWGAGAGPAMNPNLAQGLGLIIYEPAPIGLNLGALIEPFVHLLNYSTANMYSIIT